MFLAEYLVSVVVMSLILGALNCASYPHGSEKTVKFAASVLLLYTALVPFYSLIKSISNESFDGIFDNSYVENFDADEEYKKVAENSFKDGIRELLFTKYAIKEENMQIYVFGFDFKNMRAEKITVVLYDSDILGDYRGIEEYVRGLDLGECEVKLSFG